MQMQFTLCVYSTIGKILFAKSSDIKYSKYLPFFAVENAVFHIRFASSTTNIIMVQSPVKLLRIEKMMGDEVHDAVAWLRKRCKKSSRHF
jgi:hypothetical protein